MRKSHSEAKPQGRARSEEAARSPIEERRQRIRRAEALLDRWLDLYDVLLERADAALRASDAAPKLPDLSRLTDLANAFTITRRACEIELLARRLDESVQSRSVLDLDPDLLMGTFQEDDEEE